MRSATNPNEAVYTLRVDRDKLEQLRRIAESEHRTVVQKLRVMIEDEIARHPSIADRSAA